MPVSSGVKVVCQVSQLSRAQWNVSAASGRTFTGSQVTPSPPDRFDRVDFSNGHVLSPIVPPLLGYVYSVVRDISCVAEMCSTSDRQW